MRILPFVLFLTIFLSLYGLINYYIILRGWQAFPIALPWRLPLLGLSLLLSLSFVAGRILERFWISPVSSALVWAGSFWLGAMLYFFLAAVALDLFRLVNHVVPLVPGFLQDRYAYTKQWVGITVVGSVIVLLLAGHVNAIRPRVRQLDIHLRKRIEGVKTITIAAASDIHLGTIIGRDQFNHMVDIINSLHPDIILLPGDIVDEDLGPVIRANLGEHLRALQSREGVYAVTGNHEYIGGVEQAVAYLREHGVTVLRDSCVTLPSGVIIAGREDRSSSSFAGKKRKDLSEILDGADTSKPVILMDHQPFHLEEAEHAGVDFQLSGHTHHGQLWPLNYITNAIYEISWGYLRKGATQYYVSCGAGTWGPPVRLGNRPEILLFRIIPDGTLGVD